MMTVGFTPRFSGIKDKLDKARQAEATEKRDAATKETLWLAQIKEDQFEFRKPGLLVSLKAPAFTLGNGEEVTLGDVLEILGDVENNKPHVSRGGYNPTNTSRVQSQFTGTGVDKADVETALNELKELDLVAATIRRSGRHRHPDVELTDLGKRILDEL